MTLHVAMVDHAWVWFDCDRRVWVLDCPDCECRWNTHVRREDREHAVKMVNRHNANFHGGRGIDGC